MPELEVTAELESILISRYKDCSITASKKLYNMRIITSSKQTIYKMPYNDTYIIGKNAFSASPIDRDIYLGAVSAFMNI